MIAIGQSIPLPSGPAAAAGAAPARRQRGARAAARQRCRSTWCTSTSRSRRAPGSAALRHSQSLNVATFHEPVERVLSTQVARMLVEVFFGRIDARTASNEATGELLAALLPGPVRADQAGRRRRRARPRAAGGGTGADRLLRRGGARRPAPAAPGPAEASRRPRLGGRDLVRRPDRSAGPRQPAAAGAAARRPATGRRARGVPGRSGHRLPRLRGRPGRPGRGPEGVRRRRRSRRLRPRALPRAGRARASAGCSSRSATCSRWRRSSSGSAATRRSATSCGAAARDPAARRGPGPR